MRTPLAALRVTVDVLSDSAHLSTAEVESLVGRLQRGLAWLEGMVENFATSTIVNAGQMALQRRVIAVTECVDGAVALVEPLFQQRRQHIEVQADPMPLHVCADPQKVTQVLINLLLNACSYAPEGTVVEVRVQALGDQVEVRVIDSGPGVSASEREQIFQRYARGMAGGSRPAGMGLGLHIVKSIVELHGGRVGVDPAPGHGASFWFVLPRASQPAQITAARPHAHTGHRRLPRRRTRSSAE